MRICMPKIMLTGSKGFVGARTLVRYPHAVVVPGELVRDTGEKLFEFVQKHQPEFIINAAAISDIGTCEKNSEASYLANVTLPVVLAKASKEIGAKLISFSSDQVYTGCEDSGPYREDRELPPPANIYAQHKLEAENRVLDIAPESVMLRATWMYDMPMYNHNNRGNFLVNTLAAIMQRSKMFFSKEEYRGITYVRQVVSLLDQVFYLPGGVYNYGSENELNMYDTAKVLFNALGYGGETYAELLMEAEQLQRHNLWMNCEKIKKFGITFDTTADGFYRCVNDYGIKW